MREDRQTRKANINIVRMDDLICYLLYKQVEKMELQKGEITHFHIRSTSGPNVPAVLVPLIVSPLLLPFCLGLSRYQ